MSAAPQALTTMLRGCITQLSYVPRTLHLVCAAAQGWTAAWVILLLVLGLLPGVMVYLSRSLIDSLTTAIGAGTSWDSVRPTFIFAASMAGVALLTEFLQSALEWVRTNQAERIQDYISNLVHEKSASVDLAFYDSPEFHDRLDRARSDARTRPLVLLENGGSLLQHGITLLAMATVLMPYGAWLPLVLIVSTLPAVYVMLRFNRRYHRWWWQTTSDRRWTQYYDWVLTSSPFAAELRLFSLGAHFRSAYQALRHRLRSERLRLIRDQALAGLIASAAALLVSGTATAWMVWRALQGLVTLGDLVLFYQAFTRGQSLLRSLLRSAGQIYTDSLFLGNLFEFLELERQVIAPSKPTPAPSTLKREISFRQVTFRYPGSDKPTLQDFNLTIPAGQIVAIIGANGAGKSTLVKLLCRFYDPEAGRIELDGIDIRELSTAELRDLITVLFQWPVAYHATAGENIALGDLSAHPGIRDIEAAARGAGAHEIISRLPRGYETQLGKWFANGSELSAGEWQRIALARAFLRRAQILILDEPTSFMDPWAETEWFERLRVLAKGRTAIVITHRFTTAMRADRIHVMQNGRIVESGNHDQLIAQGGLYAQSWAAQMKASAILS